MLLVQESLPTSNIWFQLCAGRAAGLLGVASQTRLSATRNLFIAVTAPGGT